MKKIFFLFLAVTFITSLMAQKNAKPLVEFTAKHETLSFGADKAPNTTPFVRTPLGHNSKSPADFSQIGQTFYNLPTNAFARNTVSYRNNSQDVAVVWTTGQEGDNTSRGTGINYYYAGEGWGPQQNERIESIRTGWGTHGFTEEGEIVVSHDALDAMDAGIVVCTRAKWGEGEWQQYTLAGPTHCITNPAVQITSIMWPTMVTNGNIVHMVCVTSQATTPPCGYMGHNTVPLYYRSSDGGLTWDIKAYDFLSDGMTEDEIEKTSGDNYVLSVRGDHLVLLYNYKFGYINYMESLDGGDTWTKKVVFEFPWNFSGVEQWRFAPGAGAAYIDENHKVHVVFSGMIVRRTDTTQPDFYNYNPYDGLGLVYWNSDHDPITLDEMLGFSKIENGVEYYDYGNYESYFGFIKAQSVLGYDDFYFWDLPTCPDFNSDQFRNQAFAPFPRVLAQDGRVYVSYQSHLDYPLVELSTNNFYRGIFLTVSDDDGETWDSFNNTSWISYHPFTFICNWENYQGPYYVDEEAQPTPMDAIIMDYPTDNAYPTMSLSANNDRLILQWFSCYKPFVGDAEVGTEPINVFTLTQSLGAFPKYANIQEVYKKLWDNIGIKETPVINAKIYPNPASNIVHVQLVDDYTPFTLTVSNMMGQVVHTMKGQQSVADFNVSNFVSGIYIVTIKTTHAISTQKLIVR